MKKQLAIHIGIGLLWIPLAIVMLVWVWTGLNPLGFDEGRSVTAMMIGVIAAAIHGYIVFEDDQSFQMSP